MNGESATPLFLRARSGSRAILVTQVDIVVGILVPLRCSSLNGAMDFDSERQQSHPHSGSDAQSSTMSEDEAIATLENENL